MATADSDSDVKDVPECLKAVHDVEPIGHDAEDIDMLDRRDRITVDHIPSDTSEAAHARKGLREAENAVQKAQQEGRSGGLDIAREGGRPMNERTENPRNLAPSR